LRLVHSLDRRNVPTFRVHLRLSREIEALAVPTPAPSVASATLEIDDIRAVIIGSGERADLGRRLPHLMARHVAMVTVPHPDHLEMRIVTLHPSRVLTVAIDDVDHILSEEGVEVHEDAIDVGGLVTDSGIAVSFDGFRLEVEVEGTGPLEDAPPQGVTRLMRPGDQLAFNDGGPVRLVGDAVTSVVGPTTGGFAIPALVSEIPSGEGGRVEYLALRSRDGVHYAYPSEQQLARGVLLGRSRRCILGRGFDENDGLSRLHALVIRLPAGVFALDVASRYGLRDVAKPARYLPSARIDDNIGCLVYGAGHLLYEA
jgi:hypothetical protein